MKAYEIYNSRVEFLGATDFVELKAVQEVANYFDSKYGTSIYPIATDDSFDLEYWNQELHLEEGLKPYEPNKVYSSDGEEIGDIYIINGKACIERSCADRYLGHFNGIRNIEFIGYDGIPFEDVLNYDPSIDSHDFKQHENDNNGNNYEFTFGAFNQYVVEGNLINGKPYINEETAVNISESYQNIRNNIFHSMNEKQSNSKLTISKPKEKGGLER